MKHHNISTSNVSRETFEQINSTFTEHQEALNSYLDQLLWWNKRVNLVSRNVPRETIENHLRHSLLLEHLEGFKSAENIVDAGTGGGLPGLPLALTNPTKGFVLNDIVSKKCLAIKQIVRKLNVANVQVADSSIENIQETHPFLLISKHAFKINDLYNMTSHLPWKSIILYKGTDFKKELDGITPSLSIECHNLSEGGKFYKGKALIEIQRK
ncbi:RsmG family class I SAM-dependent methyltransferase [Fodinibius salsisoli]|uniref:Ribosomal RNA small subunit methyltransferase G n=1 Tax=Fodinibius salsisoli TaxID=2820877 RepID=A0ABT3PIU9_9BACT|nr:class I SAM-dependent methyltransferase [Fodinibius salsisoli]